MADANDPGTPLYHVHLTAADPTFADSNCYGRFRYEAGAEEQARLLNLNALNMMRDNPSHMRYGYLFIVVMWAWRRDCMGGGSDA